VANASVGDVTYKLHAVAVHVGTHMHTGHYYCDVVTTSGQWLRMNDLNVSRIGTEYIYY